MVTIACVDCLIAFRLPLFLLFGLLVTVTEVEDGPAGLSPSSFSASSRGLSSRVKQRREPHSLPPERPCIVAFYRGNIDDARTE